MSNVPMGRLALLADKIGILPKVSAFPAHPMYRIVISAMMILATVCSAKRDTTNKQKANALLAQLLIPNVNNATMKVCVMNVPLVTIRISRANALPVWIIALAVWVKIFAVVAILVIFCR